MMSDPLLIAMGQDDVRPSVLIFLRWDVRSSVLIPLGQDDVRQLLLLSFAQVAELQQTSRRSTHACCLLQRAAALHQHNGLGFYHNGLGFQKGHCQT